VDEKRVPGLLGPVYEAMTESRAVEMYFIFGFHRSSWHFIHFKKFNVAQVAGPLLIKSLATFQITERFLES
jgi:hypothetical protein